MMSKPAPSGSLPDTPAMVNGESRSQAVTSRRRFMAGAVAGFALAVTDYAWASPSPVEQPAPQTPNEALARLMEGNRRFTGQRATSCTADLASLRRNTAAKQQPFAAVLSCADSRVPPELIFDQNIGQVFDTRVAGNVATAEVIASLEYAVAELGTPVILVMGHTSCGAVKATIANEAVPGQISALFRYIRPAIDQAGTDLEPAVKANARIQARMLSESSPVLAEHIKQNTLRVVASYYDLATGTVTLLGAT